MDRFILFYEDKNSWMVYYTIYKSMLIKRVKNGHIRRVVDDEVKSLVLELSGLNVATTYITCPVKARASLGIKLPFMVMIVKNMKKYFTFEIQIADDKDMRRRFRVSNFQSTTKVRPFCTTMPIGLSPGWNQIQFNLADFTKRAYGSAYVETCRVQVHANARLRRIYFSDRLYADDEMPNEFKLFLPVPGTHRRQMKDKETEKSSHEMMMEEEIPSVAPPATPAEESEFEFEYEGEGGEEVPFHRLVPSQTRFEEVEAVTKPHEEEGEDEEVEDEIEDKTPAEGSEENVPIDKSEKPPAEEPSGEVPPAEESPAEEPQAEEPPDAEPPTEEPPAEQVPEEAEAQ
ncbi:hypothetical protein FQA39_LY13693 [Lamprigera yunnana]|nr:hypothetical protein FQA39_LY13693 [Lamprigera yunnana]